MAAGFGTKQIAQGHAKNANFDKQTRGRLPCPSAKEDLSCWKDYIYYIQTQF